jgi:hypothetical protein
MDMGEQNTEGLIITDDLLIRYLLGELQEAERMQVAERTFLDDEVFDRLIEAENDLIDRYATGELTGAERELFEKTVLPRKPMRVVFAGALGAAIGKAHPAAADRAKPVAAQARTGGRRKTLWYGLAAAAALLVVVSSAVLVIRRANLLNTRRKPKWQVARRRTEPRPGQPLPRI